MRVAVVGGGGFIGAALVDRLLEAGHVTRILERPGVQPRRPLRPGAVEWIEGDLTRSEDLDRTLAGSDAVVHLVSGTLPATSNADPVGDVQVNLVGSIRLLEAMIRRRVRRVVFLSSGGTVYGPPRYLPIDERHPTEPHVSYGIVKLAIEKYLLLYRHLHGLEPRILRVANVYGEGQASGTGQGAVSACLGAALAGESVDVWGDGSSTRDYVHVRDVAEAVSMALTYEGPHAVFNIGTGVGTSLTELLSLIESALGRPVLRRFHPARAFDVAVNVLDPTLARTELGWQAHIELPRGLAATAEWMSAGTKHAPDAR